MKVEWNEKNQLLMRIQVRHETIRLLYEQNDRDLKRLKVIEEAEARNQAGEIGGIG